MLVTWKIFQLNDTHFLSFLIGKHCLVANCFFLMFYFDLLLLFSFSSFFLLFILCSFFNLLLINSPPFNFCIILFTLVEFDSKKKREKKKRHSHRNQIISLVDSYIYIMRKTGKTKISILIHNHWDLQIFFLFLIPIGEVQKTFKL